MLVAQMDWGLCNLHVCILDWADYFRERAEFISVFDENRCEYYFRAVRRDQRLASFLLQTASPISSLPIGTRRYRLLQDGIVTVRRTDVGVRYMP